MSLERDDPKECQGFLDSDLWSIPRVAFLSLKTVHCFTDPPGCAWSVERRGYLRSRRGSQDMVGGDKPLIVDSVEEYPF